MRSAKWVVVLTILAAGAVAAQEVPMPAPQAPPPGGQMRRMHPGPGMQERAPFPAPEAPRMRRPDLGTWWKNSEIVREIGVSEEQGKQIEQTFFDHRLKLIDLKAAVEREETRLQPLMMADQVNETQISAQVDKVLAARAALEKANVMMMLSIRRVLTLEQWKKLEAIRQERERPMRMRMPSPPPPPGDEFPEEIDFVPPRAR